MVRAPLEVLHRVADGIKGDLSRFSAHVRALSAPDECTPGLYAYRFDNGGGTRRLHLRVQRDGSGLLFVNGAEVIHLNSTATRMARLVLEKVPTGEALARLWVSYPDTAPALLEGELAKMAEMITSLAKPSEGCPTCEISAEALPVFSVRAQAPYKADLALHYACNNRCAHCYNEPGRKTMPSLPADKWRLVLRKLRDIGVPHIIFTGGEPTLHPHLVELIEYAESLGQVTGVNTNGRRLAEPAFTAQLKAAGLDHVQVTINSHRPDVHNQIVNADAFDETIEGIRQALDVGLYTITNTTLVRQNAAEAVQLVDFLCDLGLRTFAMNGMIHSGCGTRFPGALTEAELRPILLRVKDRADLHGMRFLWYTPTQYCRLSPVELGLDPKCCNAGEYSICIEPNGDVLPCQSYYQPVGNLLADPWEGIWESDLFRMLRDRREKPAESGLPEKCWNCEQLSVCGGGCPLERAATSSEVRNT